MKARESRPMCWVMCAPRRGQKIVAWRHPNGWSNPAINKDGKTHHLIHFFALHNSPVHAACRHSRIHPSWFYAENWLRNKFSFFSLVFPHSTKKLLFFPPFSIFQIFSHWITTRFALAQLRKTLQTSGFPLKPAHTKIKISKKILEKLFS